MGVEAANRMAMFKNYAAFHLPYIPARDLTQEDANFLVTSHAWNHDIELEKPVGFDAAGFPTYPRRGERVKVKLHDIGGVLFKADSAKAAGWITTGSLDQRTVVLAVRLANYLRRLSKWGVSTIFWGGMGVGRDENDRHGLGYAIDFHGAETRFGRFMVAKDWGNRPITLPNGKKAKDWPVSTVPYYRLDTDTLAGEFFYDVYHFLAGEASDNGRATESSIGGRSQILCPDTPDPKYRPAHQDHIHCEIDR